MRAAFGCNVYQHTFAQCECLRCNPVHLCSPVVTMTLQAKAGQAYDSAAQGAKQAQDYTQVCAAHTFCPGTMIRRCEKPAGKRTLARTAEGLG